MKLLIILITLTTTANAATFNYSGHIIEGGSLFNSGAAFSGSYTFNEAATTRSAPPVSVFEGSISDISFKSDNYEISGINGNIIYDIEDGPYYEANSLDLTSSVTIEGYSLERLSLSWEPNDFIYPAEMPPLETLFNIDNPGFLAINFGIESGYDLIGGKITSVSQEASVSQVPIPAAAWLFAPSLMVMLRNKKN